MDTQSAFYYGRKELGDVVLLAQIILNGQTWTTSGPSITGAGSYMCTGSISLAATNMGVKDHITVAGSGWTGPTSGGYKGDIINVHWSEGKGNKTHDWKPFDKVAGYPREAAVRTGEACRALVQAGHDSTVINTFDTVYRA